jgi:hypothetical protein
MAIFTSTDRPPGASATRALIADADTLSRWKAIELHINRAGKRLERECL